MRQHPAGAALAAALVMLGLGACTRDGPDQLMASARDYMARSDFPAASIQLRNAVQAQPDSAEARLLLGEALLQANDPLGAESELRRALELGRPRDEVLPLLAQALVAAGKSAVLVREYADKPPAAPMAHAQFSATLGDAYVVLQRRDEAVAAFRKALELAPGLASARLGLAQLDAQAGRLDASLAAVDAVIADEPRNAKAHALRSDLLLARGDAAGARRALELAVQVDPSFLPARYALVATLIGDGSFDRAREQLDALAKSAPDDVRLVYFQALLAQQTGDLGGARDKANQILKVAPAHVPTLVLIARVELQSNQYASAEAHLRSALAQAPGSREAHRLLATLYLRTGQHARAKQALQPLLSERSKTPDPRVLLLAGEAALFSGDLKQAAAYYEQAAAVGKKTAAAAAHTRLGQIALAGGRTDEGVRELESAASADPSFRQTDLALVSTHLRNGDVDKAMAAAQALLKKNPQDPLAHQVLGMVHLAKRDPAAARTSFERALELSPGLVSAARALAELDVASGKADVARKRYEAMIQKDPRNATLHLALAELQLRTGAQAADVVQTLRNAVASDPSSVDAQRALISALARSGDLRGALTAAQEAEARHPQNPQLLQMLATLQAEVGDHNQSLETLRRLGRLQPGVSAPLQRVAAHQANQKKYDQAAATLRLAKEVAPADVSVSRDLIVLYLTMGRPDDAMKEARAVQTSAPRNSAGWLLEGQIHESQRRYDEAEKALRRALKIEPDSGVLAARLHATLVAAGKSTEADTLAGKWLGEHPKDIPLRIYLGDRAMRVKDHRGAAAQYRSILEIDPNNVVALNNLAWISGQAKDPKAIDYAERAVKLAPDSAAVLDTMGTLLVERGEAQRGVDYLARASRIAPERPDIRLNYAKGLMRAGQKDAARRELETLMAAPSDFPGKPEVAALLKTL